MSAAQSYAHQNSGNLRDDGNYTAAGKGQVCIPTPDKNLQFRKIKAVNANQVCFDCPGPRPTWASVTYGAFCCMACISLAGLYAVVVFCHSCCWWYCIRLLHGRCSNVLLTLQ